MKIKKLTTHIVHVDLSSDEQFAYSQYWFDSRRYLIVEVESADGTVGVGEAFGPPEVTAAVVESVYAPLLLGRDPLDRDNLWLEMYNKLRDHGRKGVGIEALSALDIALCDLAGKEFGVPVYRLFGRHYRDSVQAYATGLYRRRSVDNTAALVREARQYVDQGFKAMKSKIGFGLQYDREVVTAIREAIGPDVLLAADVNHGYETSQALAACKFLEPLDIAWLEEPVVPEHLAGYRHLRRHTTIPIAGGEAEFTRYGFRELLSTGAVDIAQPDCCAAGGLVPAKSIQRKSRSRCVTEEAPTNAEGGASVDGVKINWDDSSIVSTYANIATATATREEFFLLFGLHQNWKGMPQDGELDVTLTHRMVLNPHAAKRLAAVLARSIQVYEDRFGAIQT